MALHTDIPSRRQIERLLQARGGSRVSIYLPTSPITPEADAMRIAFKNLAAEAVAELNAAGSVADREAIEGALDDLHDDFGFWTVQAHSLAVFADPQGLRSFRLPNRLTAAVQVADRYYVKPLLRTVTFPQTAWERLHLIPFTVCVPAEQRDPELGAKLERPDHAAAILAWLVDGLRLFDAEGLTPPAEVAEATDDYRDEMDPLHDWIESACELDPDAYTPVGWLQNSYAAYCDEVKATQMPVRELNESLTSRGLSKAGTKRIAGRPRKVWRGVRLVDEWMHEAAEKMLG